MKNRKHLIFFIIIFFSIEITFAKNVPEAGRPEDLPAKKNCTLWEGTASGNDPSVQIQLTLCESPKNELTGILQWSSLKSGWNRRKIEGTKEGSSYLFHDLHFLQNKPNKGWIFCLIDEYNLSLDKNKMEGFYFSKQCNDKANLSLEQKK